MATNRNKPIGKITMENARIFLRNFSGRPGKYTPEGVREFVVAIPNEQAAQLAEDGWNIGYLKPREEGDTPQAILRVAVSFAYRPPEIYMVVGRTKTLLTEATVGLLDTAEIVNVDLRIRPRVWQNGGNGGVKAYLEKMYVTVEQDDLDAKYNFDDDDPDEVPF